ncbi:MAG: dihydroorotase [Myxococcota bacterium]|jgi:dihydroorotase
MTDTLTLIRPDDWHVHLRDGGALATLVPATAEFMGRALVMPNLRPPITTAGAALAYRARILEHVPEGSDFSPLMTCYLTDRTTPEDVRAAADTGYIPAFKLYPAGATTNSDSGVTNLETITPVLEAMAEAGLVLCIHGEVTTPGVDIFDRERVFIEQVAIPLVERFPELRIVLEHITTAEAACFVQAGPKTLGATITPQHLLANRNDMLIGGIRPHYYCLPILKRESDRQALVGLATSTHPRVFLGTDSAPHAQSAKETSCGCAGCFTAPIALPLYAEAFDDASALDRLEAFASLNGPAFYDLPPNTDTVTLVREPMPIPDRFPLGTDPDGVVPWRAGTTLAWSLR